MLHRLEGPPGHVHLLAFSPDGKVLASSSEEPSPRARDRQIVLWDVATGKVLRRLAGHPQPINGLTFSPDGKAWRRSASATACGSGTWRRGRSGALPGDEIGRAVGAGFSADSRDLTTVSGDSLLIVLRDWDVATGRLRPGESPRDGQPYRALTFAPDGRSVAAAGKDGRRHLFDAASGKPSKRFAGTDAAGCSRWRSPPTAGGWSPAAGAGRYRCGIWTPGRKLLRFAAGAEGVPSLAVSPDGKAVATASAERGVVLWDLKDGREIGAAGAGPGGAYRVAFLPDGAALAAGCRDGAVRLFGGGKEIRKFTRDKHHIDAFALSPDGALLATLGQRREQRLQDGRRRRAAVGRGDGQGGRPDSR